MSNIIEEAWQFSYLTTDTHHANRSCSQADFNTGLNEIKTSFRWLFMVFLKKEKKNPQIFSSCAICPG